MPLHALPQPLLKPTKRVLSVAAHRDGISGVDTAADEVLGFWWLREYYVLRGRQPQPVASERRCCGRGYAETGAVYRRSNNMRATGCERTMATRFVVEVVCTQLVAVHVTRSEKSRQRVNQIQILPYVLLANNRTMAAIRTSTIDLHACSVPTSLLDGI